ncbi:MAG: protein translocase subunit SecD [Alphaproteobacteria bacterium]
MVHIARWQIVLIVLVCVFGLAFAAPNLVSRTASEALPDWLPHKQISLGLDLQGGSHLLLEVEVRVVIKEHLESVADSVRVELRKARIRFLDLNVQGDSVVFRLRDPAKESQARDLMRTVIGNASGGNLFGGQSSGMTLDASNGRFRLSLTEQALTQRRGAAVEQSIEVVRRRIDELGTVEATIQRQGSDRIIVQVPGLEDPERLKRLLGKTAKMNFRLVDEKGMAGPRDRAPPGSRWLEFADPGRTGEKILIRKRIMVSGENLVDAQPTFQDGQPVVSIRFDTVGGRRFGQATRANVKRRFAIVLDDKVISAPVINEPIPGGNAIISGSFTVQSAQELALLLRAGALPAPLTVLEERTVGPGLGADSVTAGKLASVLGLIFVIVFMVVSYGRFGAMADVALLVNLGLLAGALSALQATLTLPGIAGIVLTIGMAVDANVLIFERIREELRAGRTPISAVDSGYRRALTTIIDSNITTFIAALLLFMFGSGAIRGFAVTLSIGIATSMFTAIMVTRLIVILWLRRTRPKTLTV